MAIPTAAASRAVPFRHEAFFYSGRPEFLDETLRFVQDGIEADEAVLVVLSRDKIADLRAALGDDRSRVSFLDMAEAGRNPARIIPAWHDFVDGAVADLRGARGIGEPIWGDRRGAELVECQLHEALLNVAFDDGPGWVLMCPYDVDALSPEVLDEAFRTHPNVLEGGVRGHSELFEPDPCLLEATLPEPSGIVDELPFGHDDLPGLRRLVVADALRQGLSRRRTDELALAVHEIATNSLRHGGGRGLFRVWSEPGGLVCEVSDAGRIKDPLIGRQRPGTDQEGGRGVWLANQLCDLVQVRTSDVGTVVRLHLRNG